MKESKLMDLRLEHKPFEYPQCYEYYKRQAEVFWLPDEVNMADDINDYQHKLKPHEVNLINNILRFFTTADQEVMDNYNTSLVGNFPKPEVKMMLTFFAGMEVIHQDAYSHLNDTLGLPDEEYKAFREYAAMKDKFDLFHIKKLSDKNPDLRDLATNLAVFGGFIEGVSLFSSFAILLNFPRRGLMKSVGQIVSWSIRDENCFDDQTEVLTGEGWKLCKDVSSNDVLAQMSLESETISFAKPLKVINKHHKGAISHIKDNRGRIDCRVTPDHDLLVKYKYRPSDSHGSGYRTNKWQKVKPKDFKNLRHVTPVAGRLEHGRDLTDKERLLIAIQADGYLDLRAKNQGQRHKGTTVTFSLKKEKKISRLSHLLDACDIDYSINTDSKGFTKFRFVYPAVFKDKSFSWVDLTSFGGNTCSQFIEELSHWDSYVKDGNITYVNTCKSSIDVVSSIAILGGYKTNLRTKVDNRKPSYKDCYQLYITNDNNYLSAGRVQIENEDYNGHVYCFTMPEGTLVSRRNGKVIITGNCHSEAISYLFRTLVDEYDLLDEDLVGEIQEACREIVNAEFNFIDKCFELGDVDGLTANDVKSYVMYMANYRMKNLGLKPIFPVRDNPLPWITQMMSAKEHANFFETRATEYVKSSVIKGDWYFG